MSPRAPLELNPPLSEPEVDMNEQLDTLSDRFVEEVWQATALFCAVLLFSVPLRLYHMDGEWTWVNLFFIVVPFATLVAFRFRHRFSTAVRTTLPLALQLFGGMAGVLGVGLMGASVTFLVLSNVVVAMLLSRRQVQVVFGVTVIVMLVAAVGFISGRFPLPYNPHLFPTSVSSWVHSVLTVTIMTFVLIRGITDYRRALQKMAAQLIEQNRRIIEQKRQIEHQATHDDLTGLPKRRWLRERLDVEISRARRESSKVAVLFIDLDGFKLTNDTYGHDAGDHLLRVVGQRLLQSIRAVDVAARMGGDEFLVVACGFSKADEVQLLAQKLNDVVGQKVPYKDQFLMVGASIGTAVYPDDAQDLDELISLADNAMYVAKRAGRGRVLAHAEI
jgi:diguanylate cyclase (GGDEF)-like protein